MYRDTEKGVKAAVESEYQECKDPPNPLTGIILVSSLYYKKIRTLNF